MIQIRKGVFETNSSSSHSLVYRADSRTGKNKKSDKNYNINLYDFYGDDPENGILAVSFGCYNWNGDPCTHFRTKLAYLLTQTVRGSGFEYWGNELGYDNAIKIKNQEDWDNVIENYVMKDPEILRILDFIKSKCPQIKGFKFYWYDTTDLWDLEHDYRYYKERHNIKNDLKIPPMSDSFFQNYSHDIFEKNGCDYLIGFGGADHQSYGYLSGIKDLDTYLFDNNMWVIITNDNIR